MATATRGGDAPRTGSRGYASELAALSKTYAQARRAPVPELRELLVRAMSRSALYVGSGGALAVARLAADLHEHRTRTLARTATPLELAGLLPVADSAVIMFSASARHPDALTAIRVAVRTGADPVGLADSTAAPTNCRRRSVRRSSRSCRLRPRPRPTAFSPPTVCLPWPRLSYARMRAA